VINRQDLMARYEPNSILRYEMMANLIKTAQLEELIEGRQLDCASARSLRDAGEAKNTRTPRWRKAIPNGSHWR
jgi:hypothetical protein